jgi:hypothetical protein
VALARHNFPLSGMTAGHIHLAHFPLLLLCAFLASCALQFRPRLPFLLLVRGVIRTFLIFVLTGVTLAWLIYPLSQ